MRYYVISSDGQKYGPADVPTLNTWAQEGRLLPNQMLEDEHSGQRMAASSVEGLTFPVAAAPVGGGPVMGGGVTQPNQNYNYPTDNGATELRNAWICAVFGFCCCLFVTPLGIMYASRAQAKGNPGASTAKTVLIILLVIEILFLGYRIYTIATGQFKLPTAGS